MPPLSDFTKHLDTWCEWLTLNHGRSPLTAAKYRQHLVRYAMWVLKPPKDAKLAPEETVDPLNPTAADLERFTGLYAHSLKLTPRARRPLVSALRGFFTWACANRVAPHNPAAALPLPQAGRPLPKAMQLRDAEKLLMQPDITTLLGLRDACILILFMGCGFRLGGLLSLNESSLVWYEHEGRDCLAIRVMEKGNRERVQPVPNEASMLLRAYLGHEELATIPRTLPNGDRVLFISTNNHTIPAADYYGARRRLHRRSVQDMISDRCDAAGVPADVAHPHALRHLFGAELQEDEIHPLVQQAVMGHASLASTEIYAHIAVRRMRKAIDQANPLAKMRGPLLDSLRTLDRTLGQAKHARSDPRGVQKSKTTGP